MPKTSQQNERSRLTHSGVELSACFSCETFVSASTILLQIMYQIKYFYRSELKSFEAHLVNKNYGKELCMHTYTEFFKTC